MKSQPRKRSVYRTLICLSVVICAIPITIMALMQRQQLHREMQQSAVAGYQLAFESAVNTLQSNLQSMLKNCESLTYQSKLLEFLTMDFSINAQNIDYYLYTVRPLLSSYQGSGSPAIQSLSLYIENPKIPEGWPYIIHASRVEDSAWYQAMKQKESRSAFLGVTGRYLFPLISPQTAGADMVTVAHAITSLSGQFLGAATISCSRDVVFAELMQLEKGFSSLLLSDAQGQMLFSTGQAQEVIQRHKAGEAVDGHWLVLHQPLPETDLIFSCCVDMRDTLQAVNEQITATLAWILAVVFTAIGALVFLLRHIFRQFDRTIHQIESASLSENAQYLPETSYYEVNRIIASLNTLLRQREHIAQLWANTRLTALQYQINPHFIYNTLDVFRAHLTAQGETEVARAITDFARLLRYNLSGKSNQVTLREELETVREYVSVRQLALDTRIAMTVSCPEELLSQPIMKFFLQPLVENSVRHGLDLCRDALHIHIAASRQGSCLVLELLDDGRGIAPKTLEILNQCLQGAPWTQMPRTEHSTGIGLENIHARLLLFYHRKAQMEVRSVVDEYTQILITLPLEEERHADPAACG